MKHSEGNQSEILLAEHALYSSIPGVVPLHQYKTIIFLNEPIRIIETNS